MKVRRCLLAPVFVLATASVFAEGPGLTREEVQAEVTQYNEIRMALEEHKDVALRYGCDFSAVSFSIGARMNCDALVERIAAIEGVDAKAKVVAFSKMTKGK